MALSCKYSLRVLDDGTEFDGVTKRKRTYLSIESGTGFFLPYHVTRIKRVLDEAKIENKYLPTDSVFAVKVQDLFHCMTALEKDGIPTKDMVPYFVWRWICETEERPKVSEEMLREKLGDDIWKSLHPYQRVCVQKAAECKKFYIADEMGTGKTFQCLASCKFFQNLWPALVFCPSSLRYTWRTEIVQWLGLTEGDVLVVKNTKHFLKNHEQPHSFLVMPYSLLINKKVTDLLATKTYRVVVMDEAHYVKSAQSKRAQHAQELSKDAPVKLLLSGTPFNYPSEMFQQIKIINPELYPRFFNGNMLQDRDGVCYYAKRYCKPFSSTVRGREVWSFRGYDNHEELNALLNTFMIRRRKADILTQLPEKNRICITLDPLPKKQEKEIEAMLKAEKQDKKAPVPEIEDGLVKASEATKKKGGEPKFMESFRLTSKYKIPNAIKFIKEQILEDCMTNDPGMKVLIFFHHQEMQKALEEMLTEDTRFPYFVISGKTDALQRDEYMKAFQTSEGFRIGLLSITAAGVGLTLTAAKVVVFTELLFGPNDHFQAEDRAHRLGQKSAVNIFYLIQPKTTDDINFGMIRKKDRESGIMLDGHATHLQSRRVAASSLLTADSTEPLEKTHISTIMKREKKKDVEIQRIEPVTAQPFKIRRTTPRPMIQVYKLQPSG